MNRARILVLILAITAGGIAAYLASRTPPAPVVAAPEATVQMADVLTARSDIALGRTVTPQDLHWQKWPAEAVSPSFIQRSQRPNAIAEIAGSIARTPVIAGEPVRESKLAKTNGGGVLSVILPAGMRAISTDITPETGASGFILPNDRVDVILTRRGGNPDAARREMATAEVILSNIRVLAIDQTVEEKDGTKTVIGKTATLELSPEEVQTLTSARQSGSLSLALRSIADSNAPRESDTGAQGSINIVRHGQSSSVMVPR